MSRPYLSRRVREFVLARDKYCCVYCGKRPYDRELHLDHVVPVSRGGATVAENLVVACRSCNIKKSAKRLAFLQVVRVAPAMTREAPYDDEGKICGDCGGVVFWEGDSYCTCRKSEEFYCECCDEVLDYEDEDICYACRERLYEESE